MYRISVLVAFLILLSICDAEAQRRTSTYESLLQRTDQPSSYVDHIILPAGDNRSQFTVIFRLDYDFLPFLRIRPGMDSPQPEAEYFAPLRMGLEVFQGQAPSSRRSSSTPVFRDSWQDTLWVNTFEETTSRFDYTQGFIPSELENGDYHYEVQLARAGSVREQSSTRRSFKIENENESETADFILLSDLNVTDTSLSATLLNYGSNVLYGQDYSLLIKLPSEEAIETDTFTFNLYRLPAGSDEGEIRYTNEITNEDIIRFSDSDLRKNGESISLNANLTDEGTRYAYVNIPNQELENSRFKLSLAADGKDEPVGERNINSQWLDMPVSLYNLDVAIDMMRFIVSDQELRQIRSGSAAERESNFRDFWEQRDPSPDTEFNELMAEYYSRIDHAYKNFTTLQSPGYDTDQGRAYILYGEPQTVERRLPTNAPTREIWEYPNRTLIFEATTGFGDFRLVSES